MEEQKVRSKYRRRASLVQAIANENAVFDYDMISYFDAVLAHGVMLSSQSAIENGLVGNSFDLTLCPSNALLSNVLARLYDHGILVFRSDTSPEAIDPESRDETRFSYYPLKVNWQFATAKDNNSFSKIFNQIGSIIDQRADHPEYFETVSELWWMLGRDDALRYLDQELNSYRLSGFEAGEKTKEAISYALNRFSIPQLRYLLWRVAKNAAALSVRHDFTKRHALNTIPGSLIRDCDRAIADHWTIKPYCMKWDEEEAPLITILFDRVLETGIAGFRSMTGAVLEEMSNMDDRSIYSVLRRRKDDPTKRIFLVIL